MSYIGWDATPSPRGRTLWRFFPLGVVVAMSVVVVVNVGLVYAALHSFPGKAGDEDFALSNHYNSVLEQAQRDAALGWAIQAQADDARRPVVTLSERGGSPLRGASVTASVARPLGAPETRALTFHETAAGHYVADAALTAPGQWELTLSASIGGHDMAATRRIIVH